MIFVVSFQLLFELRSELSFSFLKVLLRTFQHRLLYGEEQMKKLIYTIIGNISLFTQARLDRRIDPKSISLTCTHISVLPKNSL